MEFTVENSLYTLTALTFMNTAVAIVKTCCTKRDPEPQPFDYELIYSIKEQINELKQDILDLHNQVNQANQQDESESVEQYQIIPPNRIIESEEAEQTQDTEQTHETEQTQDAPAITEDKHSALCRLLANNSSVYCSYKGTSFQAIFQLTPTAPHGYVIRDSQNNVYETPTDFSFTKKRQVNPNIHSDNGWDSVYIQKGENKKGNPKKLSLKKLVDPL